MSKLAMWVLKQNKPSCTKWYFGSTKVSWLWQKEPSKDEQLDKLWAESKVQTKAMILMKIKNKDQQSR